MMLIPADNIVHPSGTFLHETKVMTASVAVDSVSDHTEALLLNCHSFTYNSSTFITDRTDNFQKSIDRKRTDITRFPLYFIKISANSSDQDFY